jgi:acyl-CoA thioester hydrolase
MTAVPLRWRDLDALGHVNHAVVLTLFEEGRDAWLNALGIARDEYVIGRCTLSFEREVGADLRSVDVACVAVDLRGSSLTTRERLTGDGGRLLVQGEFELVLWDPRQRRPRPITDGERSAFARDAEAMA